MSNLSSRDRIEQHLIQQKKQAALIDENGTVKCQYLTPDGLKCAAGCLIPEGQYNPEFEGSTSGVIFSNYDVFPSDIDPKELRQWQRYHDHDFSTFSVNFSYQKWIEGDEAHHPSLVKAYMAKLYSKTDDI